MSQQLLRRAWDALDTFRQAYPENWHDEDQQVMDDLMKADLDLSGVERKWVGLTDEERKLVIHEWRNQEGKPWQLCLLNESKLKEKNGG